MPVEDRNQRLQAQIEAAYTAIDTEFAEFPDRQLFWHAFLKECLRLIENNEIMLPEHAPKRAILEARNVHALDQEVLDQQTNLVKAMRDVYDAYNLKRQDRPTLANEAAYVEFTLKKLILPLVIYNVLRQVFEHKFNLLNKSFPEKRQEMRFRHRDDVEAKTIAKKIGLFLREEIGKFDSYTRQVESGEFLELFSIRTDNWMLTTGTYGLEFDTPLIGDYCLIVPSKIGLRPIAADITFMAGKRMLVTSRHVMGEVDVEKDYSEHESMFVIMELAKFLGMESVYFGEYSEGQESYFEYTFEATRADKNQSK